MLILRQTCMGFSHLDTLRISLHEHTHIIILDDVPKEMFKCTISSIATYNQFPSNIPYFTICAYSLTYSPSVHIVVYVHQT